MQQAQVKGVWELMCWGLAVLLRRINGLKPDLPSSVAQCQVQPNWPGECRPVAGAIPWRLTQTVAHVASLTLFASLYMANSLQTGSSPGSRGEDRIPARHTHLASHVLTFAKCSIVTPQFWSPQTQLWYKQGFWSVRRRTPGPANTTGVWQYEKDRGCKLCMQCTLVLLVSGSQGATIMQSQKCKERKESNLIFTGKVILLNNIQI